MSLNVLLIDPPFQRFMGFHRYYFPIGLAYLAACAERMCHAATVYDAEHSRSLRSQTWIEAAGCYDAYVAALEDDSHPVWNECREVVASNRPDVIGISALSVKSASALKVASICKRWDRDVPVIFGGDHATACPEEFLRCPTVDLVVRGEGEVTFGEVLRRLNDGTRDFSDIRGLSYRRAGRVCHNPRRDRIADLDEFPTPAIRALRGWTTYRPIDLGIVITSRGCPFSCRFCGVSVVWGRSVRYRSLDSVINEVRVLHSDFGVRYVSFRDASFTLDRQRTLAFCDRFQEVGSQVQWECLTRFDLLDAELLRSMRKAGCVMLRIGVESGNEEVLTELGKSTTVPLMLETANVLRRTIMPWSAYVMLGAPSDTKETIAETLRLVERLSPDQVTVSRYAPIPGTPLHRELLLSGRVTGTVDWRWESNQSLRTGYTWSLGATEFGGLMEEAGLWACRYNARRSGDVRFYDPLEDGADR